MTQRIIWMRVDKFVTETFEISPQGAKRVLSPILVSLFEHNIDDYLKVGAINLLADPQMITPLLLKEIERENVRCLDIFIKIQGQIDRPSLFSILEKFSLHDKISFRNCAYNEIAELGKSHPQWPFPLIERDFFYSNILGTRCIREFTVKAVGELAQNNPQWASPLIEQAFNDKDFSVIYSATEALYKLAQNNPQWVLPIIERAFKQKYFSPYEQILDKYKHYQHFRLAAFKAVVHLAQSHPKWAIPLIEQALNDMNFRIRRSAAFALSMFAQSNPKWAIPLIEQLFENDDCDMKFHAVKAMRELAQNNPEWAIPLIERAFKDKDSTVRMYAVYTLEKLVQSNPEWAFLLIERAFDDEASHVRRAAVETMGKLAQSNLELAFPLIERAFDDKDGEVSQAAINAVVELIQSNPEWSFYQIEQIFNDKYPNIWEEKVAYPMAKLASKIDWSLSSEHIHHVCLYLLKWNESLFRKEKSHLSSTPLNSLIKNYIKEKKSSYHPDYLLLIAIKCIEQSIAVFLKDNNTLCFYEQGEMHHIENFPDAEERIILIQQTIKELLSKYKHTKEQN